MVSHVILNDQTLKFSLYREQFSKRHRKEKTLSWFVGTAQPLTTWCAGTVSKDSFLASTSFPFQNQREVHVTHFYALLACPLKKNQKNLPFIFSDFRPSFFFLLFNVCANIRIVDRYHRGRPHTFGNLTREWQKEVSFLYRDIQNSLKKLYKTERPFEMRKS